VGSGTAEPCACWPPLQKQGESTEVQNKALREIAAWTLLP
jgi:hypothetical protein